MHKVFGTKDESLNYYNRVGCYVVLLDGDKVGLIRIPKGLVFLGGGKENGETHIQTIKRESREEIGYDVEINGFLGSAEAWTIHNYLGPYHPIQYYYCGKLKKYVKKPIEKDHELVWMTLEEAKGKMYSELQNWGLEQM